VLLLLLLLLVLLQLQLLLLQRTGFCAAVERLSS